MRTAVKASLVSYLVASIAYGPWALAQPKIVPLPSGAAPAPAAGAPKAAERPAGARKKGPVVRRWKMPPTTPDAPPAAGAPAAPAAAPTPPAGTTTTSSSGVVEFPGEKEFNSCKKYPQGKAILKLN